jgi:signal transduction histidine kinase
MNRDTARTYLLPYGTAVLVVALALLITALIWPLIKPLASPLFLAAIMIAAWRGGRGAGLLTTLLSGFCLDYFFVPPQYQLGGSWEDMSRLIILAIEGLIISLLIASRKEAGDEVIRSREHLRALSVHLQSVREAEMTRIAREIHDELGQVLTGLKYDVYWLNGKLAKTSDESSRQLVSEKTKSILKNIDSILLSVRKIATELRPPVLDDLGLPAAIEWQAKEFQQRTGIECKLNSHLEEVDIEKECATAVFRIFQESLTNIARHANATKVNIILEKDGKRLLLQLQDNGKGIKEEELIGTTSLGILGMQERARLVGGTIHISGQEGKGTIVTVQIPLSQSSSRTVQSGSLKEMP